MPLTCDCDWGDYEYEPGSWYFEAFYIKQVDFEPLDTSKRKRCCSCNELIDIGSPVIRHKRVRYPYTDAEARICGYYDLEESLENEANISMADLLQCEKCGEIWLNLQNIGFECLSPSENMRVMLKEYQNTYNPPKFQQQA